MKKQSAVGLFFSMFLRAVVVILGIVILVFGAALLMKVMKNGKSSSNAPATTVGANVLTEAEVRDDLLTAEPTEATSTEAVTEEIPAEPAYDKNILVLNSTNVKGLAGRWCEKLGGYGYANTTASDYNETLENTKIVSSTEGIGEELVQYFNGASYEVGSVTSGSSVDATAYDIVIIIGTGDSDN